MIDKTELWLVIIGLGVGSFAMRFVFLGLIGDRPLPEWVLRHLRYTSVAILPGLVAPLVLWPSATNGVTDAPRLIAALATLCTGLFTRSVILAILAGVISLYTALYLIG